MEEIARQGSAGAPEPAEIAWVGAREVMRADSESVVLREIRDPGTVRVALHIRDRAGRKALKTVGVIVVPVDASSIRFSIASVTPYRVELLRGAGEPGLTPMVRGSDADLIRLGDREFVTSVSRFLTIRAQSEPEGFASWADGTADGQPLRTQGDVATVSFPTVGEHRVRLEGAGEIAGTTFRTIVLGPDSEIRDGEPVTFAAVTEPAGSEPYIRWRAATRFGRVWPSTGAGPVFTVRFDATVNPTLRGRVLAARANERFAEPAMSLAVRCGDCYPTCSSALCCDKLVVGAICATGKVCVSLGVTCAWGWIECCGCL